MPSTTSNRAYLLTEDDGEEVTVRFASQVTIRDVERADYLAVARILASSFRRAGDVSPADAAVYLTDLVDVLERAQQAETLVAEYQGQVIGTVTFYPDAREDTLRWPRGFAAAGALAVDLPARRLGVARALVNECISRARARGARALGVRATELMTVAINLAVDMGFRRAPLLDAPNAGLFRRLPASSTAALGFRLDFQ